MSDFTSRNWCSVAAAICSALGVVRPPRLIPSVTIVATVGSLGIAKVYTPYLLCLVVLGLISCNSNLSVTELVVNEIVIAG